MFSKNFERELYEICGSSDVSPYDSSDIAERFESLRRYRRLPPGRENRVKHLSSAELAHAIFGLVPSKPGWAGHAAIMLSDLRAAGGAAASFRGAESLGAAVELLLTNEAARESLRSLVLSTAENGINSNGFARLAYNEGDVRRRSFFVSKMALSLLQPGAENRIEEDDYHSPVSKSLILNRAFFDKLAGEIERSNRLPTVPEGDGSEYDAEEARQARCRTLGATPSSRFLNIGVDTQVTWPKQEVLIQFDKYQLVLLPKTKAHTQSVHIDLHANGVSDDEALTIINRFLSVLAWCDDQFAIAQGGWSGNPVPVAVSKRDLAFATAHEWPFRRRIPDSDQIRRALAHYREGCNAEEAALGSYAVLSFFKTIETKYPDAEKVERWIARNFATACKTSSDEQFKHFMASLNGKAPEEYLNDACRVAVAHASKKHPSDADDATEATRLYIAAHVLRALARHFIASELGVSEAIFSGD